mgnify:CR=1 FL=1
MWKYIFFLKGFSLVLNVGCVLYFTKVLLYEMNYAHFTHQKAFPRQKRNSIVDSFPWQQNGQMNHVHKERKLKEEHGWQ